MPSLQPEYIGPRRADLVVYSTDETGRTVVERIGKMRYTPAAWTELDDPRLSGDALRLLLLMRRHCDQNLTDGQISENAVKALAIEHGIGRKRLKTALDLLVRCEHVLRILGSLRDAHFAQVCFTARERDVRKERWKKAQQDHRKRFVSDDKS